MSDLTLPLPTRMRFLTQFENIQDSIPNLQGVSEIVQRSRIAEDVTIPSEIVGRLGTATHALSHVHWSVWLLHYAYRGAAYKVAADVAAITAFFIEIPAFVEAPALPRSRCLGDLFWGTEVLRVLALPLSSSQEQPETSKNFVSDNDIYSVAGVHCLVTTHLHLLRLEGAGDPSAKTQTQVVLEEAAKTFFHPLAISGLNEVYKTLLLSDAKRSSLPLQLLKIVLGTNYADLAPTVAAYRLLLADVLVPGIASRNSL